ncbi:MAG: DUF222 domain-containing protein [Candidatus Nanopelagicales bacterium]
MATNTTEASPGSALPRRVSAASVALGAARGDGVVAVSLARWLWVATRPDWTQAGWWDAELAPQVRGLLAMPLGPGLVQALTGLRAAAVSSAVRTCDGPAGVPILDIAGPFGECPFPHHTPSADQRVGVAGSPCACQVVTTAAWTCVASWAGHRADQELIDAAGSRPIRVQAVAARPELGTITDPAIEDLAPALRASPGSARHRVGNARELHDHPDLWAAVQRGLVIDWHARLLLSDLRTVDPDVRAEVITQILTELRRRRSQGLAEWTLTDLRRYGKRITARVDRDFARRRELAHARRKVRVRYHGDGAATVSADVTDDDAARIFHRLTALARGLADPDDPRDLDQLRADIFADLILGQDHRGQVVPAIGTPPHPRWGAPPPPTPPEPTPLPQPLPLPPATTWPPARRHRVKVAVVITLETLLGLSRAPARVMPGVGPIPASIGRRLAADRGWRAWITRATDAGTTVVATSPTVYRPPAALARLIRARDPHCRMPGCRSMITDLDHIIPFPRGATTPENVAGLCRRHHRMKTHTRWRQRDTSDAAGTSWRWTTPSGVTYDDAPVPDLP